MEYFEHGAIMLRKKFYMLSNEHLEQVISRWRDEQDLAQAGLVLEAAVQLLYLEALLIP